MIPALTLRLINPDGSYGRELPDWRSAKIGLEGGDAPTLELIYTKQGKNAGQLVDQAVVVVLLDGVEPVDGRFTLNATAGDEVTELDTVTWKGNATLHRLSYARVRMQNFPVRDVMGHSFGAMSPGHKLRVLLEAAQARGALTGLTWDFTDTHDSTGTPWPVATVFAEFIDAGTTYLDVVRKWAGRGSRGSVASMSGTTLRLTAWDNYGTDRTGTVVLKAGEDLADGPVDRDSEQVMTVMLAVTDTDNVDPVERVNAPGLSTYGRREGFLSQAGVPDGATLAAIADGALALSARQREEFTYGLLPATRWRPWRDYDRGDLIQLRTLPGKANRRVRNITLSWDASTSSRTGSLQFGDRFREVDEEAADRAGQLAGHSADGGLWNPPLLPGGIQQTIGNGGGGGGDEPDLTAPNPPTGLASSSTTLFQPPGLLTATALVGWDAPTTNSDGSTLDDLRGYQVQYKPTPDTIWLNHGGHDSYNPDDDIASIPGLRVGTQYQVRVRAVDTSGNVSAWSAVHTFTTAADTTAPTQAPSAPAVTAFLYDALLIAWDGLAAGGGAVDNDIRHVEVHVSTTNNFTPGAGTRQTTIEVPGGRTVIAGLIPGTTYYVKLVAVDWAGNLGATASAQATGVPVAVDSGDLADGSVTTGKLANLAVTSAKISDLSASKITAGTMSAVVVMSGEFTTRVGGAGAGTTFDSAGLRLYDPSGNITVQLNGADGTAVMNGVLGTAQISGSVYITGTGGAKITHTAVSGLPVMALQTGHAFEKYPSYTYAQVGGGILNNPRHFRWRSNTPGMRYQAFNTTGKEVFTEVGAYTYAVDGDSTDGDPLPSTIHGGAYFVFPAWFTPSGLNSVNAHIHFKSHIRGSDANPASLTAEVNRRPGVIFHADKFITGDPSVTSHEVTLHIEPNADTFQPTRFAFRERDGTLGYCPVIAKEYQISSGSALKTEVAPLPWSPLAVVLANPALSWRYVDSPGRHIGPMADDLPDELVRAPGGDKSRGQIDLGGQVGLLWGALQELADLLGVNGGETGDRT